MPALGEPQAELLEVSMNPTPAPSGGGPAVRSDTASRPPEPDNVKMAPAKWSDEYAASVVKNDFERAEKYRYTNFDSQWTENDRIYHAQVEQRVWEGTNVARSSIGVQLVKEQVESLMPHLYDGIFQNTDGIFFDVFPRPGSDMNAAIQNRELIAQQLDEMDFETALDWILRSMCIHGTGIGKLTWNRFQREKEYWSDEIAPDKTANIGGVDVALSFKRKFRRKTRKLTINRPDLIYVSNRDFYIDPSHKLPRVQGAQFVAQRALIAYDQLTWQSDNDPSFKLPAKTEILEHLRRKANPVGAMADTYRRMSAQQAGIRDLMPMAGSIDPAKSKLEIIEYWTEDRLVTLLERKWVVRNIPNPYGCIPFVSVNYLDVIDQFYGKGLAEVLQNEQRLQSGLINSHLDEVALTIHGQKIIQSGSVLNKNQLLVRPGGIVEATSVDAVKEVERHPVTQDWYSALSQSQMRAQQYTGITDMVIQGMPSQSTSITRTARGVATMRSASLSRIQYLIERIENRLVVPVLEMIDMLNQRYLDPSQPIKVTGRKLQTIDIMPPQGDFRFELRAASRMSARANMQQSLPFILQTIFNPGVIQAMSEQNVKPNINAVIRDTLEVMGWRSHGDWFMPLSPQEQQAKQQQVALPIQKEQMKSDREKQRSQDKAEMQENQHIADIVKIVVQQLMQGIREGSPASAISIGRALNDIGVHDSAHADAGYQFGGEPQV